jgi:hypothetical protein
MTALICVCCHVEVCALDWSLVQRSPTKCDVSECVHKSSTVRRPWPTSADALWQKINSFKSTPQVMCQLISDCWLINYVNSSEGEEFTLCVLSKEEKQKRIKRRRFCEHNVGNTMITHGEFYL